MKLDHKTQENKSLYINFLHNFDILLKLGQTLSGKTTNSNSQLHWVVIISYNQIQQNYNKLQYNKLQYNM